jgi:polysaccharide export outer membrane protein
MGEHTVHYEESTEGRGRRQTVGSAPSSIVWKIVAAGLCIPALMTLGCLAAKPAPPPIAPPTVGYIVGAPDVLSVNILPDPVIEREVVVRPDGKISIDLIGDIQAAGRSPLEIAAEIQEAIGRFKRDASVSVTVLSSPSQFVTIYGEVARPGVLPLDTETRVAEAIGRVGGPRPFASLGGIRLIRTRAGETRIISIDLGDIQDGDLSTNYIVKKGDFIVVPPTILAKVGYVMQMLLFPFQPLLSGASQVGSVYTGYDTVQ